MDTTFIELCQKTKLSKSERLMADYIINNFESVRLMTSVEVADAVNSSHSSVIRFAKDLGFEGYTDMRNYIRQEFEKSRSEFDVMSVIPSEKLKLSMRGFHKSGAAETVHINKWLTDNCFGDYYTRSGLDHKQREMITFCFLAAQGGCESQLTAHAKANINIGNDKLFLINIVSQCLPFIGYPRSLNAISCIENAAE